MAYITRYIFGTDKLRPNAFEVRGMNGSNTGVIQCSDLAVLSNWIKLISDYISILTSQKVEDNYMMILQIKSDSDSSNSNITSNSLFTKICRQLFSIVVI